MFKPEVRRTVLEDIALVALHDPKDEDAFTLGVAAVLALGEAYSTVPAAVVWQGEGLGDPGRSTAAELARWLNLPPHACTIDLPSSPLGPARGFLTASALAHSPGGPLSDPPQPVSSVMLVMATPEAAVAASLRAITREDEQAGGGSGARWLGTLRAVRWSRVDLLPAAVVHGQPVSTDRRLWRERGAAPLLAALLGGPGEGAPGDPAGWLAVYPDESRALKEVLGRGTGSSPARTPSIRPLDGRWGVLAPLVALLEHLKGRGEPPGPGQDPDAGLLLWLGGGEGAALWIESSPRAGLPAAATTESGERRDRT